MLKVLSYILCDLDPKVKVKGKKAGMCDGVPSTSALVRLAFAISNDIVSTNIYDKPDDFDFEIVNFPFLDGDVPRYTSYGVYISQLIRFARASSYVTDFKRAGCFA